MFNDFELTNYIKDSLYYIKCFLIKEAVKYLGRTQEKFIFLKTKNSILNEKISSNPNFRLKEIILCQNAQFVERN